MFNKVLWFVLLLALAAFMGIYCANAYKTIECNNTDKVCKVYNINSALKTKTLKRSVKVDSSYGRGWYVMGVGQNNVKNLSCCQKQYTIKRRNGSTENKIKYLLVPIGIPNPIALDVINEYTSSASCEVDRLAIQDYLSSGRNEPFVYVVSGSWLRYLWYLVSAFIVILAFFNIIQRPRIIKN